MGSAGWRRCYWCAAWTFNPYAWDSLGGRFLCDEHVDYMLNSGTTKCPMEGNAIDCTEQSIRRNFPRHPLSDPQLARALACFLRHDWEMATGGPGASPASSEYYTYTYDSNSMAKEEEEGATGASSSQQGWQGWQRSQQGWREEEQGWQEGRQGWQRWQEGWREGSSEGWSSWESAWRQG